MYIRKDKMIAIRITKADLLAIKCKAARAKLNTTAYITKAALDKPVVVVEGVDRVMDELKALGRNLNQITTLCNMGKITCPDLSNVMGGFGRVLDALADIAEGQ